MPAERQPKPIDLTRLVRQVPQAPEAEAALLGSLILDPRKVADAAGALAVADFWNQQNAAVFAGVLAAHRDNPRFTSVELVQHLRDAGTLDQIGGVDRVVELVESVPSAASADYYARLVAEKAQARALIEAAGRALLSSQSAEPLDQQLDGLEAGLLAIRQSRRDVGDIEQVGATAQRVYDMLAAGPPPSVKTGFADLDDMIVGLHPGELVIVAARPGVGKSAFALNVAVAAAGAGDPAAMLSLEMSREQVVMRLLAQRTGIDIQAMRRGAVDMDGMGRLAGAVGRLADLPLTIDFAPGAKIMQVRARARRAVAGGAKLIIIDYLQLLRLGWRVNSRHEEVSAISGHLKALAGELNVPVLALSQLNREVTNRETHRPRMSDLRESGAIEQDADAIILLHREDAYHAGEPDYVPTNSVEVLIEKQRQGPTGMVRLHWNGSKASFENAAFSTQAGYR